MVMDEDQGTLDTPIQLHGSHLPPQSTSSCPSDLILIDIESNNTEENREKFVINLTRENPSRSVDNGNWNVTETQNVELSKKVMEFGVKFDSMFSGCFENPWQMFYHAYLHVIT